MTAPRKKVDIENFNTHFAKCFVDVLDAKRSAKLLSQIEVYSTPARAR